MRILLDTRLWLWWLNDSNALSKRARRHIENPDNEVFVSAISLWETVVKVGAGKLSTTADLEEATLEAAIQFLPFVARNAMAVAKLPNLHRDPFDRALIAQAFSEGLTLLTSDETVASYASVADVVLV